MTEADDNNNPDKILAEQNAFHLVKALDLLDECYHYLKANPPSKETMTYNKWESLIEETDYMREFNADAAHERLNKQETPFNEFREASNKDLTIDEQLEVALIHIDTLNEDINALRDQLSKEREKYNDLLSSVQRHFQTLIARNYNNIGVWSNERQDYNFQLIKEIEDFLKEHNTKATELDKNKT